MHISHTYIYITLSNIYYKRTLQIIYALSSVFFHCIGWHFHNIISCCFKTGVLSIIDLFSPLSNWNYFVFILFIMIELLFNCCPKAKQIFGKLLIPQLKHRNFFLICIFCAHVNRLMVFLSFIKLILIMLIFF